MPSLCPGICFWLPSHLPALLLPQIAAACLGGGLALAVAIMYERSQGPASPWYPYLAALPPQEDLPIVWGKDEVHSRLQGTELHQVRGVPGECSCGNTVGQWGPMVRHDRSACLLPTCLPGLRVPIRPSHFVDHEQAL